MLKINSDIELSFEKPLTVLFKDSPTNKADHVLCFINQLNKKFEKRGESSVRFKCLKDIVDALFDKKLLLFNIERFLNDNFEILSQEFKKVSTEIESGYFNKETNNLKIGIEIPASVEAVLNKIKNLDFSILERASKNSFFKVKKISEFEVELAFTDKSRKLLLKNVSPEDFESNEVENACYPISFLIKKELHRNLSYLVFSMIFSELVATRVLWLPKERAFLESFNPFIYELDESKSSFMPSKLIDYVNYLRKIKGKDSYETINKKLSFAVNFIEKEIVRGKYVFLEKDNFYFVKENTSIPVEEASADVQALSSLVYFLKFEAKKEDVLLIEDPEIHLNYLQCLNIPRLICYLVNFGIKVVISTSSVSLIRQLNLLLGLSIVSHKKLISKLKEEINYTNKDYLNFTDLKVYLINENSITPLETYKDEDFIILGHQDALIDTFNSYSNRSYYFHLNILKKAFQSPKIKSFIDANKISLQDLNKLYFLIAKVYPIIKEPYKEPLIEIWNNPVTGLDETLRITIKSELKTGEEIEKKEEELFKLIEKFELIPLLDFVVISQNWDSVADLSLL